MKKRYAVKPNKKLISKAENILKAEVFDKYKYFKELTEMLNEILEYRDATFVEAIDYLTEQYPTVRTVSIQLDFSMENIIEKILRRQSDIFSVKNVEVIKRE